MMMSAERRDTKTIRIDTEMEKNVDDCHLVEDITEDYKVWLQMQAVSSSRLDLMEMKEAKVCCSCRFSLPISF